MRVKPQGDQERHTEAWRALEDNLKTVRNMVRNSTKEINVLLAAAKRAGAAMENHKKSGARGSKLTARVAKRLVKTATARIENYHIATLWQVVVLATCVEAYLQDVLSEAAALDGTLMGRSGLSVPYSKVIASQSLSELAKAMRDNWARAWVAHGGPSKWLKRLEALGARGYEVNLATQMELIWGVRHLVVHHAGTATTEFLALYPQTPKSPEGKIRVGSKGLGSFVEACKAFLDVTEEYLLSRYPTLGSKADLKRTNESS